MGINRYSTGQKIGLTFGVVALGCLILLPQLNRPSDIVIRHVVSRSQPAPVEPVPETSPDEPTASDTAPADSGTADPAAADSTTPEQSATESTTPGDIASTPELSPATTPPDTEDAVVHPVSINHSPAEDLRKLPGIGRVLAKRIVDYRELNGPFGAVEDLMRVPGINPAKFDKLKEYITL